MSEQQPIASVRIEALALHLTEAAAGWAARLNLPQSGEAEFALQLGEAGL